jgi:hypothetical protein
MNEKDNLQELNQVNIRNVIQQLITSEKPTLAQGYALHTQSVEIHAQRKRTVELSELVMTSAVAARVDEQSSMALRIKGADMGVRLTLHSAEKPVISADPNLQENELAFIQLFVSVDHQAHSALIESNVEVSENFEGDDLQGFRIGSSLMPDKDFDPNVQTVIPLIQQMYPNVKTIVISISDHARGKGDHQRKGWTTHWLQEAGYEEHGRKLTKIIELS